MSPGVDNREAPVAYLGMELEPVTPLLIATVLARVPITLTAAPTLVNGDEEPAGGVDHGAVRVGGPSLKRAPRVAAEQRRLTATTTKHGMRPHWWPRQWRLTLSSFRWRAGCGSACGLLGRTPEPRRLGRGFDWREQRSLASYPRCRVRSLISQLGRLAPGRGRGRGRGRISPACSWAVRSAGRRASRPPQRWEPPRLQQPIRDRDRIDRPKR